MNSPLPMPKENDLTGLISAIARNQEDQTLARLEPHRWSVLGEYLQPSVLQQGHLLIAQGAIDRKLYFLESGSLKVDLKIGAGLVQLAILAPGTVVGEGSFFSQRARSSSVTAYSDCKVWALDPARFSLLSKNQPSVALALAMVLGAILATRMLDLSKRVVVT